MTVTNQALKIVRGNKSIDLTASPYSIGADFQVPYLSPVSSLAYGSSANVYGGATRTSVKYNTRAWSFDVKIIASSEAAIKLAVRALSKFLMDIDDNENTYLEWRGSSDTPEPLWGQYGAALRYEVIDGSISTWPDYTRYDLRSKGAVVTLSLTIGPYALGKQQRVCTATGGVLEDTISVVDGRSRGLIVTGANTNYIPNPSFENSTYLTGWTIYNASTTIEQQETKIVVDGISAYRVTNKATGDAAGRYADISGLTPGATYTFSAWVYVISGRAQLYCFDGGGYSNGVATAALSTQGQWTRIQVSKVCPAGGSIRVFLYLPANAATYKNSAIYDAVMLENSVAATPYRDGDKLGCAWSGTAHNSSTACTAAAVKLPLSGNFNRGCGTIRVVYKFALGTASLATQRLFTLDNTGSFAAQYQSTTQILFQDGSGSSVTGTITAPTAGQVDVLHFVYGDAGMIIYRNGAALNNTTAYIAPNDGSYIYIGSSAAAASQGNGTFIVFSMFEEDLTAAQVLSDYTNLSAAITNGEKIDSIPWFWTDDGDNILSLDTGKIPLGVVGGVPGDAPAITEIQGALSTTWDVIKSIALNHFTSSGLIKTADLLLDLSGTVGAGDYGGQHYTLTISSSAHIIGSLTMSASASRLLNGSKFMLLTRLYGSAATQFELFNSWSYNGGTFYSDHSAVTPGLTYLTFYTKTNSIGLNQEGFTDYAYSQIIILLMASKISTNVDISTDYVALLPGSTIILEGGGEVTTYFAYKNNTANSGQYGSGRHLTTKGDSIQLEPNKVNHLQCYFCPDGTVNPVTTYQATFSAIYITPRLSLL